MGNSKVIFGNETLIDLTGDTVTPDTLLAGNTAHNRSGEQIVGTAAVPEELDDLTDVTLTSPAEGDLLQYDATTQKWVNGNGGGGASALDDLTDVDITTPTDGQVLTYDADSQKWVNADGGGGGGGFVLADWLTAGGLNPMSYADLAAVLADEKAVRKLMTIHLAVDYLAGQTAVDASINTILTDNTCAKWINLRDYALDTLYDNALFKTVMDASGKYFLGEWAKLSESPETWGPKGNVPIMTSNTAPYGVASAYQVFDGDNATTASGTDFSYKFVNPVCVKDFVVKDGSGNAITGGTLQASNDGSTWVTPVADTFYMAWNVHFGSSTTVGAVQFYGREMKVSVPVMTSDTAPYGEAFSSHVYSSSYDSYMAFDGKDTTRYSGRTTSGILPTIGYEFPENVCIKFIYNHMQAGSDSSFPYGNTYSVRAGNDQNNLTNILTDLPNSTTERTDYITIPTNDSYKCWELYNILSVYSVQFFGFDYSEYDWDANNPRHYLYDHGVELETITTSGTVTKGTNAITLSAANAQATNTVDLTSYNLLRGAVVQHFSGTTQLIAGTTATANMTAANAPYNESLDISNVSASLATGAKMTSVGVCDITEMWLE